MEVLKVGAFVQILMIIPYILIGLAAMRDNVMIAKSGYKPHFMACSTSIRTQSLPKKLKARARCDLHQLKYRGKTASPTEVGGVPKSRVSMAVYFALVLGMVEDFVDQWGVIVVIKSPPDIAQVMDISTRRKEIIWNRLAKERRPDHIH